MISIIVPVYNAEKYVIQLVESIKHQTYENYEVLLVNNNSTDDTEKLLINLTKNDQRFKVLFESKQGPNHARLKGFLESTGEYLYFFDSDDKIYPDTVANLVNYAEATKSDIVIGDYVEINEFGNIKKRCKGVNYEVSDNSDIFNTEKTFFIKMPLWNKLFKRSIVDMDFFAFSNIGEDMLISMCCVANSSKISYLEKEVYQYLVTENGLSYEVTLKNSLGIINTCKSMDVVFKDKFNNHFENQIVYVQTQHILFRLLRSILLDSKDRKIAFSELTEYLETRNYKNNKYYKKSLAYRCASFLLTTPKMYRLSCIVLKPVLTNKKLNRLLKIIDK